MTRTVLQIIPNMGAGGAEQACVDIVAGVAGRGDRALVVSAGGNRVAEIGKAGGIHVQHPVNSKNPATIIANAFWLARFIREQRVDIVHARSRAPAWSAWAACRLTGARFVTTFHAAYKFSNPAKKAYNRVMVRGQRVIAISQFIAAHIRNAYGVDPQKIRVIPRGIDLDRFSPEAVTEERREALRVSWRVGREQKVIFLPARLSPIKGQALLIRAMTLLPPECRDAVAVIAGDDQGRGDYRRELEALIESAGSGERVRLAPHCADMPAACSLAAVVVAPSRVPEGFGRVPVEAMAMGIPVIASRLGATVETVQEGVTGWLLPPENPGAWAGALTRALTLSPDERATMAYAATRHVAARFNRNRMIAATLAVYDEVMQGA
jgi:glycosyltransferase involved in cell wall biosynthesis